MYRWISIVLMVALTSGCAAFTPVERPDAPLEIPLQYSLYGAETPGPDNWWKSFDSAELNRLVETALGANYDIQIAAAQLRQADAVARQAGAGLWPAVDAEAGAGVTRQQSKTAAGAPAANAESQTWTAGLAASYEVDLWGRLRAGRTAEILNAQASEADLATARMTVAASVVETWVDLLSVRKQERILEKQIHTNQTLLELEKLRFANGQATALDVSQQREALAAAKAQMPSLRISEQQLLSSLAILLGKATQPDLEGESADLPTLLPLPSVGIPADLLAARPDVRAAGLRLKSADWSVAAARADRLPNITLSASAAFSSGSLDLLFDNWLLNLAGSVTGPVFDAGSRKAEVERARAEADEYLATYAQTVASAVHEVEDNLVSEKQQGLYIALLGEQLDAARTTLKDARLQYINGQGDYLSYLTAWSSVQDLERQLIAEQANQIKYRVALYRALGGAWTEPPAAEAAAGNPALKS